MSIERIELMLFVSALVALAARRTRLPYTVGLVLAGVGLAAFGALSGVELTKALIFGTLLPPLVFEAAFFLRWKELKENFGVVIMMAGGGVLIGASVVASLMVWLAGWGWAPAFAFGALIAATDPVSVIAMFKELNVKGRLRLLVEAESLLNDGVAAVAFTIALLAATGTDMSLSLISVSLLREVGGGLLCGAVVAGGCLFLAGRTEDPLVELSFSAVAAFGAFLLADMFHSSGVLAGLVAGLMVGNLGHIGAITDKGRTAVAAFWEFAAFAANSIIFLYIGAGEHGLFAALKNHAGLVLVGISASLLGRAIAVYGLSSLIRKSEHRVEMGHRHVLVWGGLRGALSLALSLGLPLKFPHRDEIIAVTFGVVAFSVIVQGLTMPILMRKLGYCPVNDPHPESV